MRNSPRETSLDGYSAAKPAFRHEERDWFAAERQAGWRPCSQAGKAVLRVIPDALTCGEHAARVLTAFAVLQSVSDGDDTDPAVRDAALTFVRGCQALMAKLPGQSRVEFACTLPFSRLERDLMGQVSLDRPETVDVLAQRLRQWASRSPVFVEEAPVHAATFLEALSPYLDTWDLRQIAAMLADRLVNV